MPKVKLNNPHGPKTKAELWRYIAETIESEGFHYALIHYTSAEYTNCDVLDPELAKLWHEYEALVKKIETHVGVKQ